MSDEDELKRLEAAGEAFTKHVNRERKPKGGGLNRRTRLKPVSDKRKTENEIYSKLSKSWLYGRVCEICGIDYSLSVHHSQGRGRLLNYVAAFKCLCLSNDRLSLLRERFPDANFSYQAGCHGFVEANRSIAETLGLTSPEK